MKISCTKEERLHLVDALVTCLMDYQKCPKFCTNYGKPACITNDCWDNIYDSVDWEITDENEN